MSGSIACMYFVVLAKLSNNGNTKRFMRVIKVTMNLDLATFKASGRDVITWYVTGGR